MNKRTLLAFFLSLTTGGIGTTVPVSVNLDFSKHTTIQQGDSSKTDLNL